ncbi:VirB4 family type IV secretion/conjugal transfer ATPase [Sinorhizobium fredii]|uniref:VirB4 family type IV secretion/conjugal transfer ATPase n=1 Tax=Rhizobium fredii TaxID=380 RepID=UPI0035117E1B
MFNRLALDLEYSGVSRKEAPSARHIPYIRHVTDNIVKTKHDQYIGVIRLNGFSFQTADNRTQNTLLEQRNTFIRSLNSSRWAIYSHIIRKRIRPELPGQFQTNFANYVNERYMASLKERTMFTNELYLTIVRKPAVGKMGMIESITNFIRGAAGDVIAELESERVSDLKEVLGRFKEQFAPYGPQLLGVQQRDGAFYSEPCEFLSQLLNGPHDHQMRLPRMSLDGYLPTHRPLFQKRAFALQGRSRNDSWFGAMLSIKEYPSGVAAGMLDRLLKLNREIILTQSFSVFERDEARGRIEKQGGQLAAGDDGESSVVTDIANAKDRLMSGLATFGDHHLTVCCLSRDAPALERTVDEVMTGLSEVGIVPVREDVNMENCYWAQLPGNNSYIARNAMISSLEVMGFSSFHNYPNGERKGPRWNTPISLLETTSLTPYFFNFHEKGGERPPGNFFIIGPTGTGKTVLQGFLISQLERVSPAPNLIFFDKDRGGEIMIRAMGGYYETLRMGQPTGFNPFQMENTPQNREFLFNLLEYLCLEAGQDRLSSVDVDILRDSISKIMGYERKHRTCENFHELLQGHQVKQSGDLASRFDDWIDHERRGWLFNNPEDSFTVNPRVIGFDMTEVLDSDRVRTAALMYIFHRCEQKLREDGPPTAFFIDEGWKYLRDEYFPKFLLDKLKTIRKLNGIIGIGTQSGQDIIKSNEADELIQQTQTKIFFPNPDADERVHRTRFKLTAREYEWVLKTPKQERAFLIKHGLDSVVARLNLKGMPEILKVLSADKDSLAEMDRLRREFNDDLARWLPILMHGRDYTESDADTRSADRRSGMKKRAFVIAAVSATGITGAVAQVPVTDAPVEKEAATEKNHWLESVEIKQGQSESTDGVACAWGLSPKEALAKRADVAAKIANTCSSVGVDPALGLSIAYQESRFNQNCLAPTTPHSGGERAEGVMQVLPRTGQRMFTKAGLGAYNGKNEDQNILAGCLYLKEGSQIAGGSNYHIAGGYHAGYDHKVWREQTAIPGSWPKTLDYANKVSNRWYPIFSESLGGYQGGRFSMDTLNVNTYGAGQTGLNQIQQNTGTMTQRISELAASVGSTETDIQSWDRNSQARLMVSQTWNGLNEALALLMQYKTTSITSDLTDESETAALTDWTKKPSRKSDDVKAVYDQQERRWKILGADGKWRYVDEQTGKLVELVPTDGTTDAANDPFSYEAITERLRQMKEEAQASQAQ